MRAYLDTSVVVASLTNEEASPRVLQWLQDNRLAGFAVSDWVRTEFSAALTMKRCNDAVSEEQRFAIVAEFNRLLDETYDVLPVPAKLFHAAARLADRSSHGLRAGDALHLAIASNRGLPLCTLDKRLARAGLELGLSTSLL